MEFTVHIDHSVNEFWMDKDDGLPADSFDSFADLWFVLYNYVMSGVPTDEANSDPD